MSISVGKLYHTPHGTLILSLAYENLIRITVEGKYISFMSLPLAKEIGVLRAAQKMLEGYKSSGLKKVINNGERALEAITFVMES